MADARQFIDVAVAQGFGGQICPARRGDRVEFAHHHQRGNIADYRRVFGVVCGAGAPGAAQLKIPFDLNQEDFGQGQRNIFAASADILQLLEGHFLIAAHRHKQRFVKISALENRKQQVIDKAIIAAVMRLVDIARQVGDFHGLVQQPKQPADQ